MPNIKEQHFNMLFGQTHPSPWKEVDPCADLPKVYLLRPEDPAFVCHSQ